MMGGNLQASPFVWNIMRNRVLLSWVIAIISVFGIAFAQNDAAAIKLRLAQSFEQNGDWEQAAELYEALFLSYPQNVVFFEGLRRGFTQLKQYDKAIDLIQDWISGKPGNPSMLSELAGVYYLKGDERKADSLWQLVIKTDPRNPSFYRIVASKLMEFRLYDRAIQLFLDARKATGKSDQFSEDLASLYSVFQQYGDATQEYVTILNTRPDQPAPPQA